MNIYERKNVNARGRAVSIYDDLAKNVYSWRRNDLHAREKPVAAGRLFVTKRKQLSDLEKQELATLRQRMRERVTPRVIQRIKLKRAGK